MTDNNDIVAQVIANEGGLVNNPDDPGGITNFGITRPALYEWWQETGRLSQPGPTDIQSLTLSDAKAYYTWLLQFTGIAKVPNVQLRYFIFDAAVNMGKTPAIKMLQRALGVADDGVLGPVTLAACPLVDSSKACRLFGIERMVEYGRIGNPHFIAGWLNRLARQMRAVA